MTAPPTVSVVVPTRDAGRTLAACLRSVRAQRYPAVELVVVDNDSTDGTREIAAPLADRVDRRGPERSAQRNHGWRTSRGDVVAFVDADMVLEPAVAAQSVAALAADPEVGALVIPEAAYGDGFLAGCRELEKRIYVGNRRAEAARVFRRRVLEDIGGYDETMAAFEDWELTDRAVRAGYRIGRIDARVWHDEGRVSLRRAFGKKRYYGRWLPAYRGRGGARLGPPAVLARPLLLARSPLRAAGLLTLKAVEWAGVAAGARDARRAARS